LSTAPVDFVCHVEQPRRAGSRDAQAAATRRQPRRAGSRDAPRWKQVVEPAPGRFMHHLELRTVEDIDERVRGWLREACDAAR